MTPRAAGYILALVFSTAAWAMIIVTVANAAPLQWKLFSLQYPAEAKQGTDLPLRHTDELMATLHRVNKLVNSGIKPVRETKDIWTLSPKTGDCDDYVVTKRHHLRKLGLNPGALRIAMVKTSWGEGHAVLVVVTTKGQFALDNLTKRILPLADTGYRLHLMQSSNPNVWRKP